MATIALRGTETKKVVLRTIDGVQKVSCLCCGCASVPDEITVVFSGITTCPADPAYPAPLTTATLTKTNDSTWMFFGALESVEATCITAKFIHEFLPDQIPDIPAGIDADDTGTPLFIIKMTGEPGSGVTDLTAFSGRFCVNNGSVTNRINLADCGILNDDQFWGYGGTATLSW